MEFTPSFLLTVRGLIKEIWVTRNFGQVVPHQDFMHYFRKRGFWVNYSKNRKNKNIKNVFSKKGHKIPMRRPPTEISGDPYFFYRKLLKKQFRGQGPPIDDLGPLFQKSKPEISANSEKPCFLCCRFFWKIEEIGGYFWGCAPKMFL